MSDVTFGPARPEDKAAILSLSMQTLEERRRRQPDCFSPTSTEHFKRMFDQSLIPLSRQRGPWQARLVACRRGERMVGYVLLVIHCAKHDASSYNRIAHIQDISLQPDERGKGLGHRLLTYAEAFLREGGATEIRASVWTGNDASEAMFRKAGYSAINIEFSRTLAPSHQGVAPIAKRNWVYSALHFSVATNLFIIIWLIAFLNR